MASVNHQVGYMDGRGGRLRVKDTQKWLIRAWVLVKSERREGGQSQR